MIPISVAFLFSFAIGTASGGGIIACLKRVGVKQTVSVDAPQSHTSKQGTTTMGGLIILCALTVTVLVRTALQPWTAPVLAVLLLTLVHGAIGFWDDMLIATRGRNLGLKARQKLLLQFGAAGLFAFWIQATAVAGRTTIIQFGEWSWDAGSAYYVLITFLIAGLSNAVNLTDGLDGLAGGISGMIALGLAIAVSGSAKSQGFVSFDAALAGGCFALLWWNASPALCFMGDTGSLALGAALAGTAIAAKQELLLIGFALIPWLETASVVIQVIVFQWRKRTKGLDYAKQNRVFRRTPLHHHFEECNIPETRIVARFYLVTAAAIAVTFAVVGHV